jgi:hypothetical protein
MLNSKQYGYFLSYFQAGADLNISKCEHSNALCMATMYQCTNLVQYLLYNGADQNVQCKFSFEIIVHVLLNTKDIIYSRDLQYITSIYIYIYNYSSVFVHTFFSIAFYHGNSIIKEL